MPAPQQQPPRNQPSPSQQPPKPAAKKEKSRVVRVRATRLGIYRSARVRPGTVFNFVHQPGTKMPSWVEEVDENNNPLNGPAEEQQSELSEPDNSSSSDDVL